ncbi:MAG: hypothetical protein A2Z16_14890 [Chloroflexi bacterium RBG_16_54_18]|nr:MAG: hypothetical protein A2Z16_14890 [Chloroflexi bacterium RBG_16_54_18]
MWNKGWRDKTWSEIDRPWDILVIGGGITGAGILRESQRAGMRTFLVEAGDFASGTSSRSSKLVHGGFRYLRNAQISLTKKSVRERERLIKEGRGLVNPMGILLLNYDGDAIPGWMFGFGLVVYDILASKWGHRHYDALDMRELCPAVNPDRLTGGFRYFDAQTDDARLVLRVIQEAVTDGAVALNYARAEQLLKLRDGRVCGVLLRDVSPEGQGRYKEINSQVVVNATGAWADDLRQQVGGKSRLRRLRGSHILIPFSRLPLTRSVSFLHPQDGRPVFTVPWEGLTLVGTTDIDHKDTLSKDPAIDAQELEYLLQAVQFAFPCLELTHADIQATFSGIRPVIDTGKTDPSKESREHILWYENGLLTVSGGKLTTFRLMAQDALESMRKYLPEEIKFVPDQRILNASPENLPQISGLSPAAQSRLSGRHGAEIIPLIEAVRPGELEAIGNTPMLWAELRWAARSEAVVHLDDLLLRRVRLGLLLPAGGIPIMECIRSIAQPELGWDDRRWQVEEECYRTLWQESYGLSAIT